MLMREHPEARCPNCGSPLFYGLKPESAGWKVQYVCPPPDGCGRESVLGRISRSSAESEDEAHERARTLGRIFK